MDYQIVFKKGISVSKKKNISLKLNNLAKDKLFINKINELKQNYKIKNVIFSVGGDGTFLNSFSSFGIENLFIPINEGTLGFYTSWNSQKIENLFADNLHIIQAPLLNISLDNKNYLCINEATIINPINTQILRLAINDKHFENFRGTGICVSTPTGSSGYNKSLGGAIFNNNLNLYQLVKIAPLNNIKYRSVENPIIFSKNDILSIVNTDNDFSNSILTIDQKNIKLDQYNEIKFNLSNYKLLILSNDISFWDRIKVNFLSEN